jgi:N-acetylneuraminic acid mutarotase
VAGTFSTGPKPSGGVAPKVAPAGTAGGPWSALPDYPIAIMDNAMVAYEGELYSFGGRTAAGATASSYRYDPETSTWSALAPIPRARQKAAVGLLSGKIYVAGGWSTTGDTRADMDVYDPVANTWTTGPSMPGRTTAAGTAVVGDQLYVIGGCITECSERQVYRYDASDRAWTRLADYPRDVSWQACGGVSGVVYCAGGTSEGGSSARTYRYDAAANAWVRLADLPNDLWGMGSTVSGGTLLVSGGVVDGTFLTNEGYAYDVASNTWSALPNSRHSYYRSGSACGFAKVGGSSGNFVPSPFGEVLSGHADCGDPDPVRWLKASPSSFTIAPGASVDVTVTLDGKAVDQPGTYVAALEARDETPYTPPSVAVSLRADPPASWGKLAGTVYGRDCAGVKAPLAGASVRYDGPLADRTLRTDATGAYAVWQDRANSPAKLVVTKDGWFPATGDIQIRAGQTTVKDFTLNRTGCPTGGNR